MPIIKSKFVGHWFKSEFESPKSHNIYEVDAHWDSKLKKWVAVSCTCKGFTNRMNCRHLEEINKDLKDFPEPEPVPEDLKLALGFWYRCPLCSCVEFMIKPVEYPIKGMSLNTGEIWDGGKIRVLELICSQCGRMYKL